MALGFFQNSMSMMLCVVAGLSYILNIVHYFFNRRGLPRSLWYVYEEKGLPRSILRGFTLALLLFVLAGVFSENAKEISSDFVFVWFAYLNVQGLVIRIKRSK